MNVCDIETDGLYSECTKIHCAVFYDTETDEYTTFTPNNLEQLIPYIETLPTLSMHNGIGFDLKVLKKLYNYDYRGDYIDTLLLSQILWPDIEKPSYKDEHGRLKTSSGRHSVEAWGIRLGIAKPSHSDWSQFSPEMLHRCKEDVKIQTALYIKCNNTMQDFTKRDSRLNHWPEIIDLEQTFWRGMEVQADNGWLLDVEKINFYINQLQNQLDEIQEKLDNILPLIVKQPYKDKICMAFKKNGEITFTAEQWISRCSYKGFSLCGDFCRISFERLNLNSSDQLKTFLLDEGWTPRVYNFKKDKHGKPLRDEKRRLIYTSPKVPSGVEEWEQVAKEISSPSVLLLVDRNKISHRLNMLKGFLRDVRADNRIEARMFSCGTNTARARHAIIVNIPKAEERVYFGKECRGLFTVPKGKILVGVDASALEARCEAHYLYKIDKSAAELLIHGDIHTLNAKVWDVERSIAKNGKYALTYGCSKTKLADTLNKPNHMAEALYDVFWGANPALKELVDRLQAQFKSKRYLVAIDGRPLSIRYEHALLNTVLQSAGAIVMKKAWVIFNEWRTSNTIPAIDVGNFHDELQIETFPEYGEIVGKEIVKSIGLAGQMLRFNVPLTGDWKIGLNWAETH